MLDMFVAFPSFQTDRNMKSFLRFQLWNSWYARVEFLFVSLLRKLTLGYETKITVNWKGICLGFDLQHVACWHRSVYFSLMLSDGSDQIDRQMFTFLSCDPLNFVECNMSHKMASRKLNISKFTNFLTFSNKRGEKFFSRNFPFINYLIVHFEWPNGSSIILTKKTFFCVLPVCVSFDFGY